jgi:hypothetical protein
MKIFFNGCSWTYGEELKNPEETRYSKLICNHFNAEETNIAISGGSNSRVLRTTLLDHDMSQYDLAIIQFTTNSRTEYFDDSYQKWRNINISGVHKTSRKNIVRKFHQHPEGIHNLEHINFWADHFSSIYTDTYGESEEEICFKSIRNHFEIQKTPYLLITIKSKNQDYDFNLNRRIYPIAVRQHPNELGHYMISRDLIKLIESRYSHLKIKK